MFLVSQLAPPYGSIRGIVIKSGTSIRQPLQNARLELEGPASPLVVRTNGSGEFVFPNLAPGQYTLIVTCDGFVRQQSPKPIVLGRGQAPSNIVFEMDPAPTAAGWVLDLNGEPIDGVMVEALRRTYDLRGNPRWARVASGLTNDRGEYRVFWLDPGDYLFYARSPIPDANEADPLNPVAPTYSPGVNTPEEAKPLRLDIGREIRVDFRLSHAAVWSVNGHTMNDLTGHPVSASITLVPPAEDPNFSRYHARSTAAGSSPGQFDMAGVVPGSYILMAKSGSGDQEITAFKRIEIRAVQAAPRGGFSAMLALNPPASIGGRFFLESRETVDLRRVTVSFTSVDPDLPSPPMALTQADGQFVLNGVLQGAYVLDISNLPQDAYMKAARFGDDDVLENPLTLGKRSPGTTPLQVLLASDGGRIQAGAYNAKGKVHPNAHVVLVPDAARRHRREQYRVAISGEDGQAILRGIPPGNYKLFAWEDLEPNAYLNSAFLEPYESAGLPVKISSGYNPPIPVRVIAKD
jgi:hypothetical protein